MQIVRGSGFAEGLAFQRVRSREGGEGLVCLFWCGGQDEACQLMDPCRDC